MAGLITGIFLCDLLSLNYSYGLIYIGIAIILWLLLHLISKDPVKAFVSNRFHKYWIFILFAGVGIFSLSFQTPTINSNLNNKQNFKIEGEIVKTRLLAEGDRLNIRVTELYDLSGQPVRFHNLLLLVKTDGYNGSTGDIISFEAPIFPFENDKLKQRRISSYMKHQGILYFTTVSTDHITKTGYNKSIKNLITRIREDIEILIEKSALNRDTGDFLISVLLGDKYFLANERKETLSLAGMAHILALSGMHVAIIISIFSFILFPISLVKKRKLKFCLLLALTWGYVFLTGSSPSTIRAALIASFMIIALLTERKNVTLNSLLAAVFIILLFDPLSLWNIGLQLSVLCVASIILFSEKLNPVERHTHPMTYNIVSLLLITIITTFTTWTLVAYHFNNIPLLFIPSNLILVPTLPLFIGTGLLYVVMLSFNLDFSILAKFLDFYYDNFLNLAKFLSADGKGVIETGVTDMTVSLWILGVIGLAIALYHGKKMSKRIWLYGSTGILVLSIAMIFYMPDKSNETLYFPHSFTSLESKIYSNSGSKALKFKRGTISKACYSSLEILAIDCPMREETIGDLKGLKDGIKKRYLLIAPGADMSQIARLVEIAGFEKVILHSTIGKNKKQELLDKLPATFHNLVYSSRENGSLEILL